MLLLSALLAAGVTQQPYGTLATGETVERYTLTNARGASVGILTYGGIVDEIRVPDREGRLRNVALALPDLQAYEKRANFGSLLGRYAGRISGGGFTLDGVRYALSDDPTAIVSHGGKPGWGARAWKAEPCAAKGCSSVTLRYLSLDGENGFPGAVEVAVTYTLTPDNGLRLEHAASTSKATVLNLSHHLYLNLAGADSGSTDNQRVQINASRFTELDAKRLPTGRLLIAAGTPLDLRGGPRLGDRVGSTHPQMIISRGFDHNFVLDGKPLAACAYDPGSGRTLELSTDQPGVQFFTGNGFDGTLVGKGGRTIRQGDGFALETQHFPDSPNRPEFPSTVLRPGETFRSTTTYRFGVAKRAKSEQAPLC
ncbi:MAG TPA: aldose epimerase family protein [Allosphingosinicella sp.]|jgi:aldose 1-epimerase